MAQTSTTARGRALSPGGVTALVAGLYLAGAVVVFWHVWSGHPTVDTQAGPDTALNTWFLAWDAHALVHGLNPFFSTAANAPYGISVLSNTSEILLGMLATPVTLAFGPIATFNVLMTLAPAASALAAYFLARRCTTWRPAAFAAGLLFGFSPYMIAASYGTHIHLTWMVAPPLIFIVLHEMLVRQRWSWLRCGLSLAALVVAQFFVSIEVLLSTAVTALVVVVAVAVAGRRTAASRWPYLWRSALVAGAVIVAALAYPTWYLVRGPGHIAGPIQLVPQAYRADLLGPLVPDHLQALAPSALADRGDRFANSFVENGSYLGVPLVAVLALGLVWLRRRAESWVVAIGAAGAFVLSLGGALAVLHAPAVNVHGTALGRIALPEALLSKISLLSNTIPARYSAFVDLFAGLLLALVLDALRARPGRGPGWLWPAAVAVVSFVPLLPAVPVPAIVPVAIPAYFSGHGARALGAGSVTLVLPYPSQDYYEAQIWQVAGADPFAFALPGGYFLVAQGDEGNRLATTPALPYVRDALSARVFIGLAQGKAPRETPDLHRSLRRQLEAWRVRNVVVPLASTPDAGATVAFLTWLLGSPSVSGSDGVTAWYRLAT